MTWTFDFHKIGLTDLAKVGGKNASLGEMISCMKEQQIRVPGGFVLSADAFQFFLKYNKIENSIREALEKLDKTNFSNLSEIGLFCREKVKSGVFPTEMEMEILEKYGQMNTCEVAVRSSATAEDLPGASFAGQHDSFLNVQGKEELLNACRNCFASLYNDRAIKYRTTKGFDKTDVLLSVGVQKMVRSDLASAGVAFTIEPETGFSDMIYVTGVWGLGENIVQGAASPDEYYFFKPSLKKNRRSLIRKKTGEKSSTLVYADKTTGRSVINIETPPEKRSRYVLSNEEAEQLAKWCLQIEEHYGMPMDIEWAKDGIDQMIYIVQARPETIHGTEKKISLQEYNLKERGKIIAKGKAVGGKIVSGIARIIHSPADGHKLKEGEILVTEITNPDWNAVLKKAAVIVTDKGGRTSHASIVARELGLSACVGTTNGTSVIKDGQRITVSCAEGDEGIVYDGFLKWEEKSIPLSNLSLPATKAMFILADPDKALYYSRYPNAGVGLLRMEFIINDIIKIHPMALVNFEQIKNEQIKNEIEKITIHYSDKKEYFTDHLSQGIAMIAAAFYPKDVIVRMSDFKSNEYANLIGGNTFEPEEENPMIGFRGASRYYNERYEKGFEMECKAMRIVREELGLENVKLMIPFCRTVEEARNVIEKMEQFGLKRGEKNLEIYMMTEIPSNVILAEEFAQYFDGFSIGSNDLTQLTLGIDRDSAIISNLFSEQNQAVMWMIRTAIEKAKKTGRKIGLCGQAPSDHPAFAQFLVEEGIDSISFNPDALIKGIENIREAEKNKKT